MKNAVQFVVYCTADLFGLKSMEERNFIVCKIKNNISLCRYGEIGRRARFRSVCLTTCEFESRYLHQVKLRMKSSWLFNLAKFERAVPTGPKRHTVQQMISTNRNCSYRAIALGKSVAADLLRFADKSAHQVRSCTSVVFYNMRVRVSLSAPSKATNEKFVAF